MPSIDDYSMWAHILLRNPELIMVIGPFVAMVVIGVIMVAKRAGRRP